MYHYWIKVFSLAEQAPSLPSANRNCQSKDLFLILLWAFDVIMSGYRKDCFLSGQDIAGHKNRVT